MPTASNLMPEINSWSFRDQSELLESAGSNIDISAALRSTGLCIEDLIYENSKTVIWKGVKPPKISSYSPIADRVSVVSFFTGCGGLDLGFEAAGFEHLAAFEQNEIFCRTLRHNRPHWKVFGPPFHPGDICDLDEISSVLQDLVTIPFEGVFIGGPPCQPFSIAANQRFSKWGSNFKRVGFSHDINGNHLFNLVKLILEFKPAAFLIENVPGLRDLDGGEQLSIALQLLEGAGYKVPEPDVHDAADHGVPQYRQRMFIIGSRCSGTFVMREKQPQIGAGSVLDEALDLSALNHETRNHKVASILRYARLDYGEREQLGRVDRLDPKKPSKTVIAGGTNGGGRSHLHPEVPRTLTVRECARLQTFPDDYKFVGPMARQFTQVGNAVPPVLAVTIASQLAEAFF